MVARGGVEPPTFRFSVGRSYQLSYLASWSGETLPEPIGAGEFAVRPTEFAARERAPVCWPAHPAPIV